MAEKNKSKKIQFLLFGICSFVALIICTAVLVITVRTVEKSNTVIAEHETQSKTELKDEKAELAGYIGRLTFKAVGDRFVKANTYTDISVDDSKIVAAESAKSLLVYAKNKMLGTVDSYYGEDKTGAFGKADNALPAVILPISDITEHTFSVGQADEEGNPVYDSSTGELVDADYYYISFALDPDSEKAAELFCAYEDEAVADKLVSEISSVCSVRKTSAEPSAFSLKAKVNRITDEIDYIIFEKVYTVKADVNFKDKLEIFGSDEIEFEYKAEKKFEYSYAGISFAQTAVTIEPGSETALSVNAVIEDDSEYKVTFTSSDDSIVTVDEMGYVKGIGASCVPVTVTVTLDYLGHRFTDECTVTVNDNDNPNG